MAKCEFCHLPFVLTYGGRRLCADHAAYVFAKPGQQAAQS